MLVPHYRSTLRAWAWAPLALAMVLSSMAATEIFPMLIFGSNASNPPAGFKAEPVKSKEVLENLDFANWARYWEVEPKERKKAVLERAKPLRLEFAEKKFRVVLIDLGNGKIQAQVRTPGGKTYSRPVQFQKNRIIVAGKEDGVGWFLYIHKGPKRPR